jgi:hypothetical protein
MMSVPVIAAFFSAWLVIQAKIFSSDCALIAKCRPRDFGSLTPVANVERTAYREQLKARSNHPIVGSILKWVRVQSAMETIV